MFQIQWTFLGVQTYSLSPKAQSEPAFLRRLNNQPFTRTNPAILVSWLRLTLHPACAHWLCVLTLAVLTTACVIQGHQAKSLPDSIQQRYFTCTLHAFCSGTPVSPRCPHVAPCLGGECHTLVPTHCFHCGPESHLP